MHVHCNNCGLMVGIVTTGGNLMLTSGFLLRFPTTLKCPAPCNTNIVLGKRFQLAANYAPKDHYPHPHPSQAQKTE